MGKTETTLYAGAGKAEIIIPKKAFPTVGEEYTGIRDNPGVRVLILKSEGLTYVLANFELVSLNDDIDAFKTYIASTTNAKKENIWICVTHSLTTPHMFAFAEKGNREEKDKFSVLHQAVEQALESASAQAEKLIQPAKFGFGLGNCSINVNRTISTQEGWWLGNNEHGPSDKSVPVFKFSTLDDRPIAILFNYNAQCSVMDGSYTSNGDKLVSGDLAGATSRFIEQEYGNEAVAMYCLGAGGDQAPELKAVRTIRNLHGKTKIIDMKENGFLLLDILGSRLGQEVVEICEEIICKDITRPIKTVHRTFTYVSQYIPDMKDIKPSKDYIYREVGQVDTDVEVLEIGDYALVGVKPEICCRTAMRIKDKSPYLGMGIMTFVNGGAKYMPEADMYDMITFQSMNSRFVKGTAERFEKDIIKLLQETRKN